MKILPVVKTANNMLPLAERCKASWDYFHPDIPMHIAVVEDWKPYMIEVHQEPRHSLKYPVIVGLFYAIQKMMVEKYDLLLYFDADIIITGRCDEMFTDDYDTAVSNSASAPKFYNCGVWASRDLEFIKEFFYSHCAWACEDNALFMYVFNNMAWRKKIIKVLDDEGSGVWYNECSRKWWNRLIVKDDQLYTVDDKDPRTVKLLHWAGGVGQPLEQRMSCSLFSDEVKQWLNKITGGTTLTDYDGIKFGECIKGWYGL